MVSLNFAALVCLILGSSIAPTLQSPITELTETTFGEYANNKDFLLVDFYAPWCSDSKALAPELDRAAIMLGKRSADVAKVDCTGPGKKLCQQYNIKRWPTLKTFRRGIFTSEYQGAHHAEAVANYINGAEDTIEENSYYGNAIAEVAKSKSVPAAAAGAAATADSPPAAADVAKSKSVPAAAAGAAVTAASPPAAAAPPAAAPASVPACENGEDESECVESMETQLPLPTANEVGQMVSTPEEVLPIDVVPVASQRVNPSPEILNQLECAKCRILPEAQRKLDPNCKSYKRECIPSVHKDAHYETLYNIRMVPGGSGKRRGKRYAYARFTGLRK